MLQVANDTPFEAGLFVLPDADGVDTAHVIIKATYDLHPQVRVAEKRVPVSLADEYWGEPGRSSLKQASDVCIGKRGTDVLVVGEACAPDERPVSELVVGVSVAGRKQVARVYGDRIWRAQATGLTPSSPEPFVRMPLVYERAFGGMHVVDERAGRILAEARNPVGKGFWGKRDKAAHREVGVPNIVHPRDPTTPVGFSFVAPTWEPRLRHAGTYDARWQKQRAPFYPDDFDLRFNNVAPPELVFEPGLAGGEPVVIGGMSPWGDLRFALPTNELHVHVLVAGTTERPQAALTTVVLEPTIGRLCMTYMAAVRCDKRVLKVERVDVMLGPLPAPLAEEADLEDGEVEDQDEEVETAEIDGHDTEASSLEDFDDTDPLAPRETP